MFESLKRYIFIDLYDKAQNQKFILANSVFQSSHTNNEGIYQFSYMSAGFSHSKYFEGLGEEASFIKFCFTDNEVYNFNRFKSVSLKVSEFYKNEVIPFIKANYPELIDIDFSDIAFWKSQFLLAINSRKNHNLELVAKSHYPVINLAFPDINKPIRKDGFFPPVHKYFSQEKPYTPEESFRNFTRDYYKCMIDTYREYFENDKDFPPTIKRKLFRNIFYFESHFNTYYNLPQTKPLCEPLVVYSEMEMNQRVRMSKCFEEWWEREGQWLDAGGTEQVKQFAEKAWITSKITEQG